MTNSDKIADILSSALIDSDDVFELGQAIDNFKAGNGETYKRLLKHPFSAMMLHAMESAVEFRRLEEKHGQ